MPYNLDIPGFMTHNELEDLERLAQMVPDNGIIVEVGSLFGRSAYAFHESMPKTAKLYCIDWWSGDSPDYVYTIPIPDNYIPSRGSPRGMDITLDNFKRYTSDLTRLIAIKGTSPEVFANTGWTYGKVDLFFLDSNHKNPNDWDNIKFWFPYMKKGSIFAGHDKTPVNFPVRYMDIEENIKRIEQLTGLTPIFCGTDTRNSHVWYFKLDKDGNEYNLGT